MSKATLAKNSRAPALICTNARASVALLQELLRRESVTPQECGIYDLIRPRLEAVGFRCLQIDKGGVRNLFAYIDLSENTKNPGKQQNPTLESIESTQNIRHFCFMGHVDVVPAGDGWSVGAFSGVEQGGYIWGRGAQDMKAGVAAFVCALVDFVKSMRAEFKPNIDSSTQINPPESTLQSNRAHLPILSLLLTSDEEGEGTYGTRYALEELAKLDLLPSHAIVAEPTCSEVFGDTIKNGRRGSINGVLEILGKQGHVAYPEKCHNPVEALGAWLGKLAGVELDSGDENFAPSKLVITDIRGGLEVVNVTPSALRVMFNVRNSPLSSKENLQNYIESIMQEIQRSHGITCTLSLKQSAKPFICARDSALVKHLAASVEKTCGITPACSTSGGTSDARFCHEYGVEAVEFGVRNDRIHSVDERVAVSDVEGLYWVFMEFLRAL